MLLLYWVFLSFLLYSIVYTIAQTVDQRVFAIVEVSPFFMLDRTIELVCAFVSTAVITIITSEDHSPWRCCVGEWEKVYIGGGWEHPGGQCFVFVFFYLRSLHVPLSIHPLFSSLHGHNKKFSIWRVCRCLLSLHNAQIDLDPWTNSNANKRDFITYTWFAVRVYAHALHWAKSCPLTPVYSCQHFSH